MVKIEYLNSARQAVLIGKLPDEMQKERSTEIVRLTFEISECENRDDLATFILESAPDSIQASLRYAASNNMNSDALMVMGLFPSGALHTVGQVSEVMDCTVWMKPFNYWSLLDPDDVAQQYLQSGKSLSGELFIFAISIL